MTSSDVARIVSSKRHLHLELAAKLMRPRPRSTPDAWAATNRFYPAHTGLPGPRNPYLTPHMVAWGRAIAEGRYRRAVMVCGAQAGKKETLLDVIGERMDHQPVPILYVGPSKEFCTTQFEPRLMQLFDGAPELAAKVARGKHMKQIRKLVAGVPIRLAHAGSPTALKSDPAAIALVDEYDGMVKNLTDQGSPLQLIEARGFTYADFVTAIVSTPTLGMLDVRTDEATGLEFWEAEQEDIQSPIWKLWQEGTQHHFAWPCPHCGEYFIPRFTCLKWPHPEGRKVTPAEVKRSAYVQCPRCKGVIKEEHKAGMNAGGLFVAPGQMFLEGKIEGDVDD
jgi:phage terminase large subunit GpA-like protein